MILVKSVDSSRFHATRVPPEGPALCCDGTHTHTQTPPPTHTHIAYLFLCVLQNCQFAVSAVRVSATVPGSLYNVTVVFQTACTMLCVCKAVCTMLLCVPGGLYHVIVCARQPVPCYCVCQAGCTMLLCVPGSLYHVTVCARQSVPCYCVCQAACTMLLCAPGSLYRVTVCARQPACCEIQVCRILKDYDYPGLHSKIQSVPRSKHTGSLL